MASCVCMREVGDELATSCSLVKPEIEGYCLLISGLEPSNGVRPLSSAGARAGARAEGSRPAAFTVSLLEAVGGRDDLSTRCITCSISSAISFCCSIRSASSCGISSSSDGPGEGWIRLSVATMLRWRMAYCATDDEEANFSMNLLRALETASEACEITPYSLYSSSVSFFSARTTDVLP